MQQFEINAELRGDVGKGASRRLRRLGRVPGIVYGISQEATAIVVAQADLVNQMQHEAFLSHILTLHIGDKTEKVVLKDLQRHPYRTVIMHVDFQRIDENQELTMHIPIHFLNEDKCVGVRLEGGAISHIMTEVEISCLPRHLPEYIQVDLAEMKVGDTVHLGELKLSEGVSIYALKHGGDPTRPVVNVHIPRAIEIEEEVPAEGVVAAEAVPGEVPEGAEPAAETGAPEAAEAKEGKEAKEGREAKGKEPKGKEGKGSDAKEGKGKKEWKEKK